MSWEKYDWPKENEDKAKLTYYYCNANRSKLPIRDVCNDHGEGSKREPHYEGNLTGYGTYNECIDCNALSIDSMIKNKKANILFFATWYTGKDNRYNNPNRRYFVTGYYTVDETKMVRDPSRCAIKCHKPFFVDVGQAFELSNSVLRKWRPNRKTVETFGDQLKFYLERDQTRQLISHFCDKENVVKRYIAETERVANECDAVFRKTRCKERAFGKCGDRYSKKCITCI